MLFNAGDPGTMRLKKKYIHIFSIQLFKVLIGVSFLRIMFVSNNGVRQKQNINTYVFESLPLEDVFWTFNTSGDLNGTTTSFSCDSCVIFLSCILKQKINKAIP